MTPCILTIRKGEKTRRFFFLTGSFSIGINREDDLICCHPAVCDGSIRVVDGKAAYRRSDGGNGEKSPGGSSPRRIISETTGIGIKRLRLKVLLPTAILAALCLAGFCLIPSRGNAVRQDWSVITLPAEGPYGNLRQDRAHPGGVRFIFSLRRVGRSSLNFTPGGLGDGTTLSMEIDGHPIAGPVAIPAGWGEEISVPLPAAVSPEGPHDLLIRPSSNAASEGFWGIRNVRVETISTEAGGENTITEKMETVRTILEDPMAGGMELSRCYLVVRNSIRDAADGNFGDSLESIRGTLEGRMQALLRKAVIKSRSLMASGQISVAREEIKRLRAWVPEKWVDGKRELDEAENMFD